MDGDRIVICDLEAGIGTATRLREGQVDTFVVVVEPSQKSIEVGRRVAEVAAARGARVVVVANRIASDDDRVRVSAAFGGAQIVVIPDDESVRRADRAGLAPLDFDPQSPAVDAMRDLVSVLDGGVRTSATHQASRPRPGEVDATDT